MKNRLLIFTILITFLSGIVFGGADNVNLSTGDFTYDIPLMEIPGKGGVFPISLNYKAGILANQEASWCGLGWDLDVGSIVRAVNEFPDDYLDGVVWTRKYFAEQNEESYIFGSKGISVDVNPKNMSSDINASLGPVSAGFDQSGDFSYGLNLSVGNSATLINSSYSINSKYGISMDAYCFGQSLTYDKQSFSFSGQARNAVGFSIGGTTTRMVTNHDLEVFQRSWNYGLTIYGWGGSFGNSRTRYWQDVLVNEKINGTIYQGGYPEILEEINSRGFVYKYPTIIENTYLDSQVYTSEDQFICTAPGLTGVFEPLSLYSTKFRQVASGSRAYPFVSSLYEGNETTPVVNSQNKLIVNSDGSINNNSPIQFRYLFEKGANFISENNNVNVQDLEYPYKLSSAKNEDNNISPVISIEANPNHYDKFISNIGDIKIYYFVNEELDPKKLKLYPYYLNVSHDIGNDIYPEGRALTVNSQFIQVEEFIYNGKKSNLAIELSFSPCFVRSNPHEGYRIDLSFGVYDKNNQFHIFNQADDLSYKSLSDLTENKNIIVVDKKTETVLCGDKELYENFISNIKYKSINNTDRSIASSRIINPSIDKETGAIKSFQIISETGAIYEFAKALNVNYKLSYVSNHGLGLGNKGLQTHHFTPYVYKWLLTSIKSPDYVDVNNNNLADDGDYGYYVNFYYNGNEDNEEPYIYVKRTPFTGNLYFNNEMAQASYEVSEKLFLSKIETSTHEAEFSISERKDGLGSLLTNVFSGFNISHSSPAVIPLGKHEWEDDYSSYLYGRLKIRIPKELGDIINSVYDGLPDSEKRVIHINAKDKDDEIVNNETTELKIYELNYLEDSREYDIVTDSWSFNNSRWENGVFAYLDFREIFKRHFEDESFNKEMKLDEVSLWKKTDDSRKLVKKVKFNYDYSLAQNTPNSESTDELDGGNKGKLTLKNLTFENNNGVDIGSYSFDYQSGKHNPNISSFKGHDVWGFKNDRVYSDNEEIMLENNDGVYWNLSQIHEPSGSILEIDYERDQYEPVCNGRLISPIDDKSVNDEYSDGIATKYAIVKIGVDIDYNLINNSKSKKDNDYIEYKKSEFNNNYTIGFFQTKKRYDGKIELIPSLNDKIVEIKNDIEGNLKKSQDWGALNDPDNQFFVITKFDIKNYDTLYINDNIVGGDIRVKKTMMDDLHGNIEVMKFNYKNGSILNYPNVKSEEGILRNYSIDAIVGGNDKLYLHGSASPVSYGTVEVVKDIEYLSEGIGSKRSLENESKTVYSFYNANSQVEINGKDYEIFNIEQKPGGGYSIVDNSALIGAPKQIIEYSSDGKIVRKKEYEHYLSQDLNNHASKDLNIENTGAPLGLCFKRSIIKGMNNVNYTGGINYLKNNYYLKSIRETSHGISSLQKFLAYDENNGMNTILSSNQDYNGESTYPDKVLGKIFAYNIYPELKEKNMLLSDYQKVHCNNYISDENLISAEIKEWHEKENSVDKGDEQLFVKNNLVWSGVKESGQNKSWRYNSSTAVQWTLESDKNVDNYGNIVEAVDNMGIPSTVIMDKKLENNILTATGAFRNQVFYYGFEDYEENKNVQNFNLSGGEIISGDNLGEVYTGENAYSCVASSSSFGLVKDFQFSEINLQEGDTYIFSAAVKAFTSGGKLVVEYRNADGSFIRQNSEYNIPEGDWEIYEIETEPLSEALIINGGYIRIWCGMPVEKDEEHEKIYIDDIRFYPSQAIVLTNTYDNNSNILSVSNSNNVPEFYEYDLQDRAIKVKDYKGRTLKETEYFNYSDNFKNDENKVELESPKDMSILEGYDYDFGNGSIWHGQIVNFKWSKLKDPDATYTLYLNGEKIAEDLVGDSYNYDIRPGEFTLNSENKWYIIALSKSGMYFRSKENYFYFKISEEDLFIIRDVEGKIVRELAHRGSDLLDVIEPTLSSDRALAFRNSYGYDGKFKFAHLYSEDELGSGHTIFYEVEQYSPGDNIWRSNPNGDGSRAGSLRKDGIYSFSINFKSPDKVHDNIKQAMQNVNVTFTGDNVTHGNVDFGAGRKNIGDIEGMTVYPSQDGSLGENIHIWHGAHKRVSPTTFSGWKKQGEWCKFGDKKLCAVRFYVLQYDTGN